MTYKERFLKALETCETLEDFDFLQDKLNTTDKINRRTLQGRELTRELTSILNKKRLEVIEINNLQPF